MALSAFDDKSQPPARGDLEETLGGAIEQWDQLIRKIGENHEPIVEDWNYSGVKYGWSMRLKRKKRVVLYMTPQHGTFLAGVVVGEKAAAAAHEGGASDTALGLLEDAPRYAEGRGIRTPVATADDLLAVVQLAGFKITT